MKPQSWLWPLSIPFQAGVQVRNRLYDLGALRSFEVGVPVISVGNITVGGTGKTPFVLLLIEHIKRLKIGKKPVIAVVSRGYGGTGKGTTIVSNGKRTLSDPFTSGDEPYMLAEAGTGAIVICDRDRVMGARLAVEQFKADIVILDDGFQHRRLKRDLDIVLLDGTNPLGNRLLLPAGYLREPVSSLKRAGHIVLSKCSGTDEEIRQRCSDLSKLFDKPVAATKLIPKYWRRVGRAELFDASQIAGKRVFAFAGIANPESFFETVVSLGAELVGELALPDHCNFGKFWVDKIARSFVLSRAEWMVMTAKDAVKLPPILNLLPAYSLDIQHQFVAGEETFDQHLGKVLATKS